MRSPLATPEKERQKLSNGWGRSSRHLRLSLPLRDFKELRHERGTDIRTIEPNDTMRARNSEADNLLNNLLKIEFRDPLCKFRIALLSEF